MASLSLLAYCFSVNFAFGHVFSKDVVFVFCMNQKAGVGLEAAVAVSGLAMKNTRSPVGRRSGKKPHPIKPNQTVVFLPLIDSLLKDCLPLVLFEGEKTSFPGWDRS